jgi:DNA-binding NarL/FixJ family response regulator
MTKIKILIADDQPIVCEGLNVILKLEEDFEVVGICHSGQETLDFCRKIQPDIILMDARMPQMSGIEATKEISRLFPKIQVLILTTFNEETLIYEGLQNGAKGFLLKDTKPDELCKNIRIVHAGGACLHPEVTLKVLGMISAQKRREISVDNLSGDFEQLTGREKEVLNLIGRGLSNIEIANVLFITEGTVKNHVTNLLAKLGARDRTQLAILAQKI